MPGLPKVWNDYDRLDAADLNADMSYLLARLLPVGYAESTAVVNVTATTEATAVSVLTAPAVVVAAGDLLEVTFSCPSARAPSVVSSSLNLYLFEDLVSLGLFAYVFNPAANPLVVPAFGRARIAPAAGSHVYSVRASVSSSTGVLSGGPGGAGQTRPMTLGIRYANG